MGSRYVIRAFHIALATGWMLLLAACQPSSVSHTPSQVVATVGKQEITLLQFNQVLKQAGIPQPSDPIRREITEKLIDRELAARQALSEQLDRSPEVLLQLEEARRDVLARAYAERLAERAPAPSDSEVSQYYADHPELFGERRIFRLREITLAADIAQFDEAKARLAQRQSLTELGAWLRSQNIGFNDQFVIRAAEQLPIDALPRINKASANDTVVFETPRGILVYAVQDAQPSPVPWDRAKPIIRDYLTKRNGKRVVETDLKRLRAATTIVYGQAFTPVEQGSGSVVAARSARQP